MIWKKKLCFVVTAYAEEESEEEIFFDEKEAEEYKAELEAYNDYDCILIDMQEREFFV